MTRKIPPEEAFSFYLSLGPGRSYREVAQKYGVSKRAVTNRALKDRWQERSEELDRKARQATEQKHLESIEAMIDRHLKALRVVQGKALEALRSMSLESAMDAVRALDLSLKQERLVRGEPSDRVSVSVEDTIKREYERWMTKKKDSWAEEDDAKDDEKNVADSR